MARFIERRNASSRSDAPRASAISREREQELAHRWREIGDTTARDQLVRAQLRHVVTIARLYRRRGGASLDELIAEGNFGLVRALATFDPNRGTRFISYAAYWIRACISEYLVRTRSLVSVGVQSKMFSKIRRAREAILKAEGELDDLNEQLSSRLALSPDKLSSFIGRMDVRDVPWDPIADDEPGGGLFEELDSAWSGAEQAMMSIEATHRLSRAVTLAVSTLGDRERYIVQRRLMAHRDDELTLAELGRHFGVSSERVRQLEVRALRKLKVGLAGCSLFSASIHGVTVTPRNGSTLPTHGDCTR